MKATTYGARLRKLFEVTRMVESDRIQREVVIYLNAPDGTHSRIVMTPVEAGLLAAQLLKCAEDVETNGY